MRFGAFFRTSLRTPTAYMLFFERNFHGPKPGNCWPWNLKSEDWWLATADIFGTHDQYGDVDVYQKTENEWSALARLDDLGQHLQCCASRRFWFGGDFSYGSSPRKISSISSSLYHQDMKPLTHAGAPIISRKTNRQQMMTQNRNQTWFNPKKVGFAWFANIRAKKTNVFGISVARKNRSCSCLLGSCGKM